MILKTLESHFAGPETLLLADDGATPNSRYPVLLYRAVLDSGVQQPAAQVQRHFAACGWGRSWVNGIFGHHHYHGTAHEALGVVRGWAEVQLGGTAGPLERLAAGDVAVLPAGVGHRNAGCGGGFTVVGAYPDGQRPDHCRPGDSGLETARRSIAALGPPAEDPVFGGPGRLRALWNAA